MGRPSTYSEATVEAICERLAKGEPLAAICREEGMPGVTTVWDWEQAHEGVSESIARAREAGQEWLAAECLEIADDSRNDYMDRLAVDGDEKAAQFNGEHVQRSKLRIDTRLKLLAKWNPRYGEKLELASSGFSLNIHTEPK